MSKGKGRFDLLPSRALKRVAKHFENGANKYSANNWRLGIPLHSFADSAIRHIFSYLEGQNDEDHITAAAWNLLCLIETEEMIEKGLLSKDLATIPYTQEKVKEAIEKEKQQKENSGR
jgi:hypothetical protein